MKELTKEQMAPVNGGMPCWLAMSLYVGGFIGACAVPGMGALAALAALSVVGDIIGVLESCKYKF